MTRSHWISIARATLCWSLAFLLPDPIWRLCLENLPVRPANYLAIVLHVLLALLLGFVSRTRLQLALVIVLLAPGCTWAMLLPMLAAFLVGRVVGERGPAGSRPPCEPSPGSSEDVLSWSIALFGHDLVSRLCLLSLSPRPANYLLLALHGAMGFFLAFRARTRLRAALLVGTAISLDPTTGSITVLATILGGLAGRLLAERRPATTSAPAPSPSPGARHEEETSLLLDYVDLLIFVFFIGGVGSALAEHTSPPPAGGPPHFLIMKCRLDTLEDVSRGHRATGVPLVSERDGAVVSAELGDDGLYYFVPLLANALSIPVVWALDVFLGALILLSLLLGLLGVLLRFPSGSARLLVATAFVATCRLCLVSGDVHVVGPCALMAVVPAVLVYSKERWTHWSAPIFGFAAGLVIGYANTIRSHGATPALLFTSCVLVLGSGPNRARALRVLACLAVGFLLPRLHFAYLRHERNAFVARQVANFRPPQPQHPFWHTVYIGLGFETNEYGIAYTYACAIDKVRSIRPDAAFVSAEYEQVLRDEVLSIVRKDPAFVLGAILAKLRAIEKSLLLWSNLGLLLLFARRSRTALNLGFLAALAFSAIPGVIAIPIEEYLIVMYALASIAGLASMALLVEDDDDEDLLPRLRAWIGRRTSRCVEPTREEPASGTGAT